MDGWEQVQFRGDHGEPGPFGPSQIQQPVLNISQLNLHTHCKNYCYSQPVALGKELPRAQTTDLPCLLWAETSLTQN